MLAPGTHGEEPEDEPDCVHGGGGVTEERYLGVGKEWHQHKLLETPQMYSRCTGWFSQAAQGQKFFEDVTAEGCAFAPNLQNRFRRY